MSRAWREWLDRALEANPERPDALYLQLATVRPGGRPANRTIFFRGFLEPGPRLVFTTNAHSAKVAELAAQPWAEACWHFRTTREQFRIAGRVETVGARHPDAALRAERLRLWALQREDSRLTFAWPRPGLPRAGDPAFAVPAPDPALPAENFLLGLLAPDEVDYIDLRPALHERWRFAREAGGWRAERLNP
ncbi:MAG: pyridoxamine 5'-phosphate oxidase family protein [Planctomycetota bacterium]|nr:pyridoxamine 5'-phosphate oxidase family protein [Planctomycetota bacterium]